MRLRSSERPLSGSDTIDQARWQQIERSLGITADEAESIARRQAETGQQFGETAMQMGLITPEQLRRAIEEQQDFSLLPAGDPRVDPLVVAAFDPQNPLALTARSLRGSIFELEPGHQRASRSVALVGVSAQTETAILAANLAVACAQAGSRTLLIDANLEGGGQDALFRSPAGPGLIGYLGSDTAKPQDVVQETAVAGLALLPSGPLVPNGLELQDRARMSNRLQSFRDMFDIVLVDGGGFAASASQFAADAADAAILVVNENVSLQAELRATAAWLNERGTSVLGVVLAS